MRIIAFALLLLLLAPAVFAEPPQESTDEGTAPRELKPAESNFFASVAVIAVVIAVTGVLNFLTKFRKRRYGLK